PRNLLRGQPDNPGDLHLLKRIGALQHLPERVHLDQERLIPGRPPADRLATLGQQSQLLNRSLVSHAAYRATTTSTMHPIRTEAISPERSAPTRPPPRRLAACSQPPTSSTCPLARRELPWCWRRTRPSGRSRPRRSSWCPRWPRTFRVSSGGE